MTTTSTSLDKLRKNTAPVPASGGELSIFSEAGSKLMWGMARAYATSSIVPKEYQGNDSNCFIALDMARRLDINPLTVMQQLYIVYERPAWSAQFLIGMFNNNPDFSPIRYQFEGQTGTDEWGCRAMAIEKATGELLEGTFITIGLAKAEGWFDKKGSKWKTMPEQMLRYRAAAWFIRTYAPEQGMGLMTREEVIDMDQDEDGIFKISTADISNGGSFVEAEPEASVEKESSAVKENPKSKPETKGNEDAPPAETKSKDSEAPISRQILDEIEKQLKRLGAPVDQLPPDLAEEVGTGDPSELTEDQGKLMIVELMKMKV